MRGSVAILLVAGVAACGPVSERSAELERVPQGIAGGYVDDETRGAVGLGIDFGGFFTQGHCSGTLIAPNLVLTARHCVARTMGGGPQGSVVCGQTGFGFEGQGSFFVVTPETVRPQNGNDPGYYRGREVRAVPGANDICGFDLALIILEGGGIPREVAEPLVPRIDSMPEQGEKFSAVGYGLTDPSGGGGNTRMRADDNTVLCRGGLCGGLLGMSVQDTEWNGDAPTCPGDSGGPAIDSLGRVMGALSRGPQGSCASPIYSDVGSWGDFIIETALDAAILGGYEPPFWATTGVSVPPDVFGDPCTDECLGDFLCLNPSMQPEGGTCMPPCDPLGPEGQCPEGLVCLFGVCAPPPEEPPPPEPPPGPDPLGQSCDGGCPEGYLCFSETGDPPGACVPTCDAAMRDACPNDYSCDPGLGVCLADSRVRATDSGDDGGCAFAAGGPRRSRPAWWLATLSILAFLRRRR